MSLTKTALALLLTTSVAGCIGSESELGSYARLADLATTPASDLPDSGSASYAGFAGVDIWEEDFGSLDGDLAMTVDFADGDVDGTISNLGGDAGDFAGRLALDGQLNEAEIGGRVSGSLRRTDSERSYDAVFTDESRFTGLLRGRDGEAVVGDFSGTVTVSETVLGGHRIYTDPVKLDGGFAAERE